jgi:hypothetical protein
LLRKDKIPTRGAPSLLTPAQQAEAERNRILSTLEASDGERKRAPKAARPLDAAPAARTPWAWLVFGVMVAVVAGGAGLWYGQRSVPASPLVVADATQPSSRQDVAPTPATPAAPEPAAPVQASAATIQDEGIAHAGGAGGPSLSEMLEPAPAAAPAAAPHGAPAGADSDMLSQALEAPSGAALAAAAAVPAVLKAEPKPAKAAQKAPAKPKAAPKRVAAKKAAPATTQDTDAVLLSALIAHANAAEPAAKKARPSLEQELKACRTGPKAQLAACRERACEGRSNVGLCKVQR